MYYQLSLSIIPHLTILLLLSNNIESIIHVMCDPEDERPTIARGCNIIINTPLALNIRNSRINHCTIWHVVTSP